VFQQILLVAADEDVLKHLVMKQHYQIKPNFARMVLKCSVFKAEINKVNVGLNGKMNEICFSQTKNLQNYKCYRKTQNIF
jgi:hypothetical protein